MVPNSILPLFIITSFLYEVHASTLATENRTSAFFLDEEQTFQLEWKVNKTAGWIRFQATVKTLGWIAIGFSPNGQMPESDIILGWVDGDQAFLQDQFARGRYQPSLDDSQNVKLISGREEDNLTVLTFKRSITACEPQDRDIKTGTVRLIWAYDSEDPSTSEDIDVCCRKKHGKRGSISVNLLAAYDANQQHRLASDIQTVDLLNNKTMIPGDTDTTYWCSIFKLPESETEHYIVKFDKLVEAGHEDLVRHVSIYECGLASDDHVNVSANCFQSENMPTFLRKCLSAAPIASWAIGGRAFTFPPDVGYPISGSNGTRFAMMEIHYSNPGMVQGIVDSSGMRLYYTKNKPRFTAAILEVGSDVTFLSPLIAPGMKNFASRGVCAAECTKQGLPNKGIRVFASMLRANAAARSIRLRHVQSDVELAEIDRNDNFDFNYQDMIFLQKEIEIRKGDILQLECRYDTSRRKTFTYGGYAAKNEMCLAYLLVYPAPRLRRCKSRKLAKNFVQKARSNGWIRGEPDSLAENLTALATDPAFKKAYRELLNATTYMPVCKDRRNSRVVGRTMIQSLPVSSWSRQALYPKFCNATARVHVTPTGANVSYNSSYTNRKNTNGATVETYDVSLAALIFNAVTMLLAWAIDS